MRQNLIWVVCLFLTINRIATGEQAPPGEQRKGMVGIQLAQRGGQFYINHVFSNSPAEQVGMKDGDVILRVNGRDVAGLSLVEVVGLFNGEPESAVEVVIKRGGEEIAPMTVKRVSPKELLKVSSDYQNPRMPPQVAPLTPQELQAGKPPAPSLREPDRERVKQWLTWFEKVYGVRLVMIDAKFAEKLGAIFSEGLMVLEVEVGKPAYRAGLEKWDLIYRIGDKTPLELFSAKTPPQETAAPQPLDLTLMGITGEKPMKM
jgi:C-terminal processing protease CtpA/Prc